MKRGLSRWYEYRDRFTAMRDATASGPDANPLLSQFFDIFLDQTNAVIDAAENDKPLLSSWYGNAAEIYEAFDIDYYCPIDFVLAMQPFFDDIATSHSGPSPDDTCGLIQQAAIAVSEGLVPTPTHMIAMLEPCDAQLVLHELWQKTPEWNGVPTFSLDPPYGSTHEDFVYFAEELKRMCAWLEEQTGRKLDEDRLREICDWTNEITELWQEICELQRAVPAPLPSFVIPELTWYSTQHVNAGSEKTTQLFKMMRGAAEQAVAEGRGGLPEERIRVYWPDLDGTWPNPVLGPWLAEEYGAIVVNTFQGEASVYTPIDTTSVDTMLYGLARRSINEVPMIRQARGTIDLFGEDIKRAVSDYKIDCVLFPGHKGHKDQAASIGFLREICREADVPLLAFTSDIFDPTWMPPDQVKRRIAEFFSAQGWEPLNK